MAYITKRGNSYSVRYTYEDEHGKRCDKWESFPTKEEATNRKKQIEHELAAGTFLIPSSVTVAEFLMDWLPKQCSKHKWAPKTYESNLSTIQNLIIPYIGSMEDPTLHLTVHLTLVGALREVEIVGLTPEDLDFDAADSCGRFRIRHLLQCHGRFCSASVGYGSGTE